MLRFLAASDGAWRNADGCQRRPHRGQRHIAKIVRQDADVAGAAFAQAQAGAILHESGEAISTVYFPLSGMVSMLAVLQSGEAIETGVIGREGYVGGYFGTRGWRS